MDICAEWKLDKSRNPRTKRKIKPNGLVYKKLERECFTSNTSNKEIKSPGNLEKCNEIIVVPQYTGTCWFNALLMALFWSSSMRSLVLSKSHLWSFSESLKSQLLDLVTVRYKKRQVKTLFGSIMVGDNIVNMLKPESLLKLLHQENPSIFHFNPDIHSGYDGLFYITRLLRFLGIDKVYLLHDFHGKLYWSVIHNSFITPPLVDKTPDFSNMNLSDTFYQNISLPKFRNPEVIIIHYSPDLKGKGYRSTHLFKGKIEIGETITYQRHTYILDSMMLANWNYKECKRGHQIAGVTCSGKRYLYNGWIRSTIDQSMTFSLNRDLPCELIEYDWFNNNSDFCLGAKECGLDFGKNMEEICFNVSTGNRSYIYVKQR